MEGTMEIPGSGAKANRDAGIAPSNKAVWKWGVRSWVSPDCTPLGKRRSCVVKALRATSCVPTR